MPALPDDGGRHARKWLVKEGDVKSGDIFAEIETDKATMARGGRRGKIAKTAFEGTDGVKVGRRLLAPRGTGRVEPAPPAPAQAKPAMRRAEPALNPGRRRGRRNCSARLSPRSRPATIPKSRRHAGVRHRARARATPWRKRCARRARVRMGEEAAESRRLLVTQSLEEFGPSESSTRHTEYGRGPGTGARWAA